MIIVHAITKYGHLMADSYRDDQGIPKQEGWFFQPDGRKDPASAAVMPALLKALAKAVAQQVTFHQPVK